MVPATASGPDCMETRSPVSNRHFSVTRLTLAGVSSASGLKRSPASVRL